MRYVLEDTPTGFKLTIESPAAVWRNEGGLSHRRTVEMAGSHSPLAFAYAELERVKFNEEATDTAVAVTTVTEGELRRDDETQVQR